jgi:transcriptional regulator with XRE-family HTH domain
MNEAQAAGAWAKSQRLAAGMTQQELADKSGLSVRAISNLERGRTARPHPRSLEVLAAALGLPETAGTTWAARLRADQARSASSQAPRQLPAAGKRWSQLRALLPATDPGLPEHGQPGPPAAPAQSELLDRPEPAELPTRQGAGPALWPETAVALAALAKGDPSRIGSFRLLARLGGGAMGEVFLAASRAGQPVAVKRIRAEYAHDAVFRARFAKEVAAVRAVTGAGSPRGLTQGWQGGDRPPPLTDVRADGQSVPVRVNRRGAAEAATPWSPTTFWRLSAQAVQGQGD